MKIWQAVTFALTVFVVSTLTGCDINIQNGGDEYIPPPATRILDVTVDPNPIRVGDTTLISVFIEDSLKAFMYRWAILDIGEVIGGPSRGIVTTDSNSIRLVPREPHLYGEHRGRVTVDTASPDSASVSRSFGVVIQEEI